SALFSKIELINNISNAYRKARVSAQRLFEILDLPDMQSLPSGSRPADVLFGEIRFENVTFGFDSEPVLRDLNAVIPAGQVTALVGPTGSGKSTMCDLIGRFYDPDKGRITIDGVDIREFDLHELRRNIG